jgi:hypothetical protein
VPVVQTRFHVPAEGLFTLPERPLVRPLSDCPNVPLGRDGQEDRLVVATHPNGLTTQRIGVERDGLISERFLTELPHAAFPAADVVAWSVHRGSFETVLSDEDGEHDPDRWCAHRACGHEAWQILCHWTWKLRLELGQQREPEPLRTTVCAPAFPPATDQPTPATGSAPAEVALPFTHGRFCGQDCVLQPDGSLRCPAGQALPATEERREADGSVRLVSAARLSHCRTCQLREPCPWRGCTTQKPRRVRRLLHPLHVGTSPLRWHDWSRRQHRRAWRELLRHHRVDVHREPPDRPDSAPSPPILARARRAHSRLSWQERFARTHAPSTTHRCTITLCGVPERCAASLGLLSASPCGLVLFDPLSSGRHASPSVSSYVLCLDCLLFSSSSLLLPLSSSLFLPSPGHSIPF